MHLGLIVAFAVVAIVAGVLGYALRGKIGGEIRIAASDLENFASRLESGLSAEAGAVAQELRKLLPHA